MKEQYIHAVLQVLKEGNEPKIALKGLKDTLSKRGHSKLESVVLRGVLRKLESQKSSKDTVVTVANDELLIKQKSAINDAIETLSASDDYDVIVDKTIIGGSIVQTKSHIVDNSYKTKLVDLYRSITK